MSAFFTGNFLSSAGGYLATHAVGSGLNFLMEQRGEKLLNNLFDENTYEGRKNISRYIQGNLRGQAGIDQRGSYSDNNRMAQLIAGVPISLQKNFLNYVNSNVLGGKENFDFISGRISFLNNLQKGNNNSEERQNGFEVGNNQNIQPQQQQNIQPQQQQNLPRKQQFDLSVDSSLSEYLQGREEADSFSY